MDDNSKLINFAETIEKVCVDTVQSGFMTKDLAILISKEQEWLNTQDFLEKINSNLQSALS
jgi:isocitrate dehydrogenase